MLHWEQGLQSEGTVVSQHSFKDFSHTLTHCHHYHSPPHGHHNLAAKAECVPPVSAKGGRGSSSQLNGDTSSTSLLRAAWLIAFNEAAILMFGSAKVNRMYEKKQMPGREALSHLPSVKARPFRNPPRTGLQPQTEVRVPRRKSSTFSRATHCCKVHITGNLSAFLQRGRI